MESNSFNTSVALSTSNSLAHGRSTIIEGPKYIEIRQVDEFRLTDCPYILEFSLKYR